MPRRAGQLHPQGRRQARRGGVASNSWQGQVRAQHQAPLWGRMWGRLQQWQGLAQVQQRAPAAQARHQLQHGCWLVPVRGHPEPPRRARDLRHEAGGRSGTTGHRRHPRCQPLPRSNVPRHSSRQRALYRLPALACPTAAVAVDDAVITPLPQPLNPPACGGCSLPCRSNSFCSTLYCATRSLRMSLSSWCRRLFSSSPCCSSPLR